MSFRAHDRASRRPGVRLALAAMVATGGLIATSSPALADVASNTAVATPTGFVQASDVVVGQQVNVWMGGQTWTPQPVTFAASVGSGPRVSMYYLVFADDSELVVTPDQPLLLSDGSVVLASALTLQDAILTPSGSASLQYISMGAYSAGVTGLAVGNPPATGPAGHVLQAGGVLIGDFVLQQATEQNASSLAPNARAGRSPDPQPLARVATSSPVKSDLRKLRRHGACIERLFATPGLAGQALAETIEATCPRVTRFDVVSDAATTKNGRLHAAVVCPVGYRSTDLRIHTQGRTGEPVATRVDRRAQHVSVRAGGPQADLSLRATCVLS